VTEAAPEAAPHGPDAALGPLTVALDRLTAARRPLLALDFDGTLAPLRANPDDSRLTPSARTALASLAAQPHVTLALISGRGLQDLAARAEVPPGTILVGSHGAEAGVIDPTGALAARPFRLTEAQAARLAELAGRVDHLARDGVWVEHKPASVVFHTRPMADRAEAGRLRQAAAAIGRDLGAAVTDGKEAMELGVADSTKAGAVARLRADRGNDVVLFAGDDATDETALAALGPGDIGIKVGEGATAAGWRVDGPEAMAAFLAELASRLNAR
jgi:trehalose-phosphatase